MGGGENGSGGGPTGQTSQPSTTTTEATTSPEDHPMLDQPTPTAVATEPITTSDVGEIQKLSADVDVEMAEKTPETKAAATAPDDDASLNAIVQEVIGTTGPKENGMVAVCDDNAGNLMALAGSAQHLVDSMTSDWTTLPSSPELNRQRNSSPNDARNVTLPGIDSMGLGLSSQVAPSIEMLADLATGNRKDLGENPWRWCSMSPSPPPQPYPTPPSPNAQPGVSSSLPVPGDISHHLTVIAPSTPGQARRTFSANSPLDSQRQSVHHLHDQQYVNLNSSPPTNSGNQNQQSGYYPPTSTTLYPPIRDASTSAQQPLDSASPSTAFQSPDANTPNSANLFAQFGKSSPQTTTATTAIVKQEQRSETELYRLDHVAEATRQMSDPNINIRSLAMQTAEMLGHPQNQLAQQLQHHSVGMQTPQGPETGSSMNSVTMGSEDGGSAGARGRTPGGRVRSRGGSQAPVGGFRCEHPGCTAQPFQTQYLLNSHANVHSTDRPHFCPVQDCPRSKPPHGFKRKNEMIRHGLVHESPGYICPFCSPPREHKYPRPDNLQRHVRVHHAEKDKDDPVLRDVLSQRPEGGNRGRRRRTTQNQRGGTPTNIKSEDMGGMAHINFNNGGLAVNSGMVQQPGTQDMGGGLMGMASAAVAVGQPQAQYQPVQQSDQYMATALQSGQAVEVNGVNSVHPADKQQHDAQHHQQQQQDIGQPQQQQQNPGEGLASQA